MTASSLVSGWRPNTWTLTLVDWFDGGGADALFEDEGFIAVGDELSDINANCESNKYKKKSLRTCLNTCELFCFDVKSPQKSFYFLNIQRKPDSFIVFEANL